MEIIDFRCRPPFASFLRDWIFRLEDVPGNPGLAAKYKKMAMPLPASLLERSMPEFFRECEGAGITQAVVPVRHLPELDNNALCELLAQWPEKFIGFAGLQPFVTGLDACIAETEKFALNGPCSGVYFEPGLDPEPWHVDDEILDPLYEFCQKKHLPVCFLYGGVFHKKNPPAYDYYDPARIERLACKFPDLKIALSHACWPFAAHACAVALNHENVWLSPDGFMIDHPASQDYIIAANYRLQDKIIFGSLYPSMPLEYVVNRYKQVLRPEVWEKIFYENARNYLGDKE